MAYITFQPSDHFNTVLYTGNGSSQNITGVGFDPDWIWTKCRSHVETHELYDKVRGATKRLVTNTTAGENTESYQSFITDGFAWSASGNQNISGRTFASWNWKANGQGSANTDGSINTTYTSANTTAGFSIVRWDANGTNGATIGHGLGATPKVVIVKCISATENWNMYHESITAADNGNLYLNSSGGYAASGGNRWARSSISSSVFGLGSDGTTNQSGQTYIAYCFTPIKGFSKFGKYVGNGDANGARIYTGFKPAFFLCKDTSSGTSENWNMYDNKRGGAGAIRKVLYSDTTDDEENKTGGMDFLSNGVKMRGTDGAFNGSNKEYLYMAFAEHPLVSSNNLPVTAGTNLATGV